jgi:hypothetical protein
VIQLKSSSLSSLLDRTVSFVPNFFFLLCTFCVSKLFFYSNKLLSIKKKKECGVLLEKISSKFWGEFYWKGTINKITKASFGIKNVWCGGY